MDGVNHVIIALCNVPVHSKHGRKFPQRNSSATNFIPAPTEMMMFREILKNYPLIACSLLGAEYFNIFRIIELTYGKIRAVFPLFHAFLIVNR